MMVSALTRSVLLSLLMSAAGAAASGADIAPGISAGESSTDRPARKLESIALSPPSFAAPPGASQQLAVTGTYRDGATRSLRTVSQTFASSNPSIATVSPAGLVTVVAGALVGATSTITATDKATGISTTLGQATVVTVTTPSPNSVAAATATAIDNPLCTAIQPFYWEIGDQNEVLASASVGTSSTGPIEGSTQFNIASASKMLYAAYVTQVRGAAANLTASDINFLHFTSGYTYMDDSTTLTSTCPPTLTPDTVNECLTLTNAAGFSFAAQNPATVGFFDYDSGHMENHASQDTTLGNVGVKSLGGLVAGELGEGVSFNYTEPLMAGGVSTTATMYGLVLRHILDGSLALHDALGTSPVCTLNSPTCDAILGGTPFPQEAWHFSIGHWVEDNPATNGDGAFSGAGSFGFYPWIDSTKSYYGIVSRNEQYGAYPSVQCGRLIRRAFITGIEQTGTIPTD
jgi:hypothetical protein